MFCKNCGTSLADNAKFCNRCGTGQETSSSNSHESHRVPNYEFKTVRCYPDDSTEDKYRNFYQDCGWQIIDMDRKQIFERQDYEGTKHYSTQTHIKMQRDKNQPDYIKIKELSDKAESFFDRSASKLPLSYPEKPKAVICIVCFMFYIIPLFVYLFSVKKRNKAIELSNDEIKVRNSEIEEEFAKKRTEANKALDECRTLVNGI